MSDPTLDPDERRSADRDRRRRADAHQGSSEPRIRSAQVQNAVIAVAILAELVWLVGHAIFAGPAMIAATPRPLAYVAPSPPSGGDVLVDLAAVATAQPALTRVPRAHYAYVKTAAWSLDAASAGKPAPSPVLPTVTESWTAPDGAGRVLTVTAKPRGSSVDDRAVQGGHPLPALSPSEAALARRLASGQPANKGPVGELIAFTELASRQPISPAVESALLRLLAQIPGLVDAGTVIDRGGRPGIAVSLDSGTATYTLVFDLRTGMLLGEEQTLIGNPGGLDVRPGSVIAYTSILSSGYVASTAARP